MDGRCTNPNCKCRGIPKVPVERYDDWTKRSEETAKSFGKKESK